MTDEPASHTAALLCAAIDPRGRRVLPWVVRPVRDAGKVLELSYGPGVLAAELPADRLRTVDLSVSEPTTLPGATNSVDAVCLVLVLARLRSVDAMFAEVRRVLRPGGTLVTIVPSVTVRSLAELQLARLLRPVRRGPWPNRSGLDAAGWLLAAADFAVMGDDRVPFAVPLPDAATALDTVAELPATGLWPPELSTDVRTAIADELARRAGPGRVLPVPMRRLVARR